MTANRPQPRPGVLDIEAYVPGKSKAPGIAKVFKLSSNETPSGPSARTIAAYRAVADHLEDYPDGSACDLREAIGDVFGLDPDRIVCGAGSDDLLNLIARAYLATATRRSTPRMAFWSTRSQRSAPAPSRWSRRRRISPPTSMRSCGGDAAHQESCSWPIRTIRPGLSLRSTRSSACIAACRATCCWCSTRLTPNTSAATTIEVRHRAGRHLR